MFVISFFPNSFYTYFWPYIKNVQLQSYLHAIRHTLSVFHIAWGHLHLNLAVLIFTSSHPYFTI
jgi:hypothetical protein